MLKKSVASIGDRLKYVNMADINRHHRRSPRNTAPLVAAPTIDTAADLGMRPHGAQPGSDAPTRHQAAPSTARARAPTHGHSPALGLTNEVLLTYVELLFFAYRDFTSDPDSILQQLGFGRAHHRVLHFVHRYPGLRVAELLQILKITKQSLSRVLRELVEAGHVEQRTGPSDRRERLLFATAAGAALADRLAQPQIERIARALAATSQVAAGVDQRPSAIAADDIAAQEIAPQDIARSFLYHLVTPTERAAVDGLILQQRAERPAPASSLNANARLPRKRHQAEETP